MATTENTFSREFHPQLEKYLLVLDKKKVKCPEDLPVGPTFVALLKSVIDDECCMFFYSTVFENTLISFMSNDLTNYDIR
jgi:hypothetical protein